MITVDLSAYGEDFVADPYPVYAKLRESGPVHHVRTSLGNEVWLIVGHAEARAALADPRLSKAPATVGRRMLDEEVIGPYLLVLDPPDHTRLRRLVAREFTGRRVEALRPRVQRVTDELIDAMEPHGRADLVDALAFPLPITVICELLGVPAADRDAFRAWSSEIVAPTGGEFETSAVHALGGYLDALIEDKRCAGPTDDLLSALVRTRAEDGDRLSAAELRAMAYLLLIAGHETTVNLIANGVRALLEHPGQLAALRADRTSSTERWRRCCATTAPSRRVRRASPASPSRSGTRSSRPAPPSSWASPPATGTPRGSPTPTGSTSAATPPATWPSGTASTTASVRRWPGWRAGPRSAPC